MAYTNSPLVAYTKISPNRTPNRNHAIDTITIHCVVGQCSVETLGNVFAPTTRQASSNYGVGVDGRIGMYCEEKDRSWCSSNAANDHRAITIEVASDTSHPYAVNDKAYAALIDLVTDICKRNGIKKLVWSTDKNQRVNHLNGCNMTVHRDYANKSCPGDYLYERHGDIAAKVNARLGATETPVVPAASNEETIWNFLKGKGLNAFSVAGIMGNLYAESGLRPNNLQNTYEKSLGFTDDSYTSAVDNGSYGNFVKDSAGYGLAQWTYWSRKQALLDYAKSVGKSIGDLGMQLDFLWKELQGYTSVMKVLNSATTVLEASNAILTGFERPADMGATVQAKRAGYGQTYYDKYAGGTVTPSKPAETVTSFPATPFTVQVIVSDLNYRSEGSMNGAIKGQTGKGVFTIVEVNKDGWGKLKSGAGWIYLGNPAYCTVKGTVATPAPAPAEFKPYMVRVKVSDLNIRKGAGVDTAATGQYTGKGCFTIVEEAKGKVDADGTIGLWGKLKSGAGWICLAFSKFTEKI